MGTVLVGILLTAGVLLPLASPAANATAGPDEPLTASSLTLSLPAGEQRYIVKYGDEANAEAESRALEQKGLDVKGTLSHAMKASVVVATPGEIESLKEAGGVASVEIDTPVSVSGATSIWGLDRIDQRSGRDGQYSIGDEGAGVDIYIVDTGLNLSHVEFANRVTDAWSNVADGRGVWDCAGHGTHVAGTAAGTTYGVAKKANIIPVRTLDCNGFGWSSALMQGMDWAIARHTPGQPAVMNLSVGGFTNASFDQTVQAAVNDGITVVAAAGNDGVDACGASPARVASAITVAATNMWDAQASWSNYGSCVDIQAPGVGIRSAWINASTGYNTMDGTSMATPHVSGAAAILLSRNRSLSPADVHQTMINNATVGAVGSNKGATPNRLLFIPAPTAPRPSCGSLKPGDAWAGVGTYCGMQGSATSTQATPVPVAGTDTPIGTLSKTPDPTAQGHTAEQAPAEAEAAPATEAAPADVAVSPAAEPQDVPVQALSAPAPTPVAEEAAAVAGEPMASAPLAGVEAAADSKDIEAPPAASTTFWPPIYALVAVAAGVLVGIRLKAARL